MKRVEERPGTGDRRFFRLGNPEKEDSDVGVETKLAAQSRRVNEVLHKVHLVATNCAIHEAFVS